MPGEIRDASRAVIAGATKWREGLLQAEDQPLPAMISELRRYTDKAILVDNKRLEERLQTVYTGGVFSVRDVHSTLEKFADVARVKIVESKSAFTLVDE